MVANPDELPTWFERALVALLSAVVAVGGTGLALAVMGQYRLWVVLLVGGAAAAILTFLAWPRGRARGGLTAPAVAMVLVASAFVLWNGLLAGHYVWVDRDPGVYGATGKWIAEHGDLVVDGGARWTEIGSEFGWHSAGMYPEPGGRLEFQFSHLTGVLLAVANGIGGDRLMFALPAVLGGLSLCVIFAVGVRLSRRPWLVLASVTALGLSLPQLSVSRDTYSEAGTQLLVWGGIWLLLLADRRRRPGVALLAGVVIGGALMSRIDALVYVVPLPILAALAWLARPDRAARRSLRQTVVAALVGALPLLALATVDVKYRAGGYYDALHDQVVLLRVAFVAAVVLGVALIIVWPRLHRARALAANVRNPVATGTAVAVGAGLVAAWALRPALDTGRIDPPISTTATLQKLEGVGVIDASRSYSEHTMTWMSWYLGPVVVALAIWGIGILIVRFIRDAHAAAGMVLTVAGICTAMYLIRPEITPDQIWASRRFVPAALPFLVLSAVVALDAVLDRATAVTGHRLLRPAMVPLACAALIVFPLGSTLPVRTFSSQEGFVTVIDQTCDAIGPNAAVVFSKDDIEKLTLLQTVRGYCGAEAAHLTRPLTAGGLDRVAEAWAEQDKQLWILGSSPELVSGAAPGLEPRLIGRARARHDLEQTLTRYPSGYADSQLNVYGARVDD